MTRIAALPMYDLPEIRDATDAFWSGLAERLTARGVADLPPRLTRGVDPYAVWTDPRLLLAQTCGYPLTTSLRGKVTLIATPCYAAEGCDGPNGRSAIIVRATDRATVLADLRGQVCAVNSFDSNSGMNVLRVSIAPLAGGKPFFARVKITGGHRESASAVAEGEADIAAIDCVTWALLKRHCPTLIAKLRVLTWTQATPWLPLITAAVTSSADLATLRETLRPEPTLLIAGYVHSTSESYRTIARLEENAKSLGYANLA